MASVKDLLIKLRLIGGKKTKDDLKGVDKGLKSVGKSALKVGAAFFAAKGLITGMTRAVDLAGRFEKVEKGFKNLAKEAGFSSQALGKLQKATDGTMSSMQLMQQANNALLLGIVDSEDQMAELFDVSQRLASALGKDTTYGIESMVTGLGRQSKLMLDNLGIMVDTNKAYKDYAENLGVTVSQLSDQQKKQAFVNAAMTSANSLVKNLGAETLSASDHTQAMKSAVEELTIAFGAEFGGAVAGATQKITSFVKSVGSMWKEYEMGMLGDETLKILVSFASKAQEIAQSGNLQLIRAQLKGTVDMLRQFPEAGTILIPVIDKLRAAAERLKEASVNTSKMIETVQLTADEARRFAEFTASAATSLGTSAILGDSVAEAFKRMLLQQMLITAQMKIQKAIQKYMADTTFAASGPMGWLAGGVKFLFGASPTRTAPSASAASSNITINQNFGGMGVIDHNFAANSIIPAINKAISTGQARIG